MDRTPEPNLLKWPWKKYLKKIAGNIILLANIMIRELNRIIITNLIKASYVHIKKIKNLTQ